MARPFHLTELEEKPVHDVEIVARPAERDALARRCGLLSLDSLTAHLTVRTDAAGEIVVAGRLKAEVVQECVVTLEPVANTIDTPFEQHYTRRPQSLAADLVIGPKDAEPAEPIEGDSIDLGELVAQHLSLALDPYPRAPDADQQLPLPGDDKPAGDSPFAVLASLRGRARK